MAALRLQVKLKHMSVEEVEGICTLHSNNRILGHLNILKCFSVTVSGYVSVIVLAFCSFLWMYEKDWGVCLCVWGGYWLRLLPVFAHTQPPQDSSRLAQIWELGKSAGSVENSCLDEDLNISVCTGGLMRNYSDQWCSPVNFKMSLKDTPKI